MSATTFKADSDSSMAAIDAKDSVEHALAEARKDLSKCIMSNSWTITLTAMVPALGYGVWKKTYTPLIAVSAVGSGADYFRAMNLCEDLQAKVKGLEAEEAAILREELDIPQPKRLRDAEP